MTKKFFILFLTLVALNMNAQRHISSVVLDEGFENNWLPEGWQNVPLGTSNQPWVRANGGHSSHPLKAHTGNYNALFYLGGTTGKACNLITPALDLSQGNFKLEFWHAQQDYDGDHDELYVYYKEGTSGTLNLLASYTDAVADWTRERISIPSTNSEVYIVFKAVQQWGYGVCLDDVKVSFPEEHDLAVTAISPDFVFSGKTVTPQVKISNIGSNDEATWSLNLTDGNGYDKTVSDVSTIAVDAELTVDFPDWTPADGATTLTATLTLANDGATDNNTLEQAVQVGAGEYEPNEVYTFYWGAASQFAKINKENGAYDFLYGSPEFEDYMFICGEYIDGEIYAIEDGNFDVYLVRADGKPEFVTEVQGVPDDDSVVGLAYDKKNDVLYASTFSLDNGSKLYTVNKSTWEFTEVGTISDARFIGIASDNLGNLYGLDIENNILAKIDTATGTPTTIGSTAYDHLDPEYAQDIGGDQTTGIIYGVIYDNDRNSSYLGSFDVTSGRFRRIGGIEAEFDQSSMCAVIPAEATAVNEDELLDINVFPNPSNGIFTINVDGAYTLEVTNIAGQLIKSVEVNNGSVLNIEVPGVYFLKFTNGVKSLTKKVIVK